MKHGPSWALESAGTGTALAGARGCRLRGAVAPTVPLARTVWVVRRRTCVEMVVNSRAPWWVRAVEVPAGVGGGGLGRGWGPITWPGSGATM